MLPIQDVAPNGQQPGQSQAQQQLIASVAAQQRVIASQAGTATGDATAKDPGTNSDPAKAFRESPRRGEPTPTPGSGSREQSALPGDPRDAPGTPDSAIAQSVIEAQEASTSDKAITAAFQARHGLTDLLSVIRDPEDKMLPKSPES